MNRFTKLFMVFICVVFSSVTYSQSSQNDHEFSRLKIDIQCILAEHKIPGAGIALVKDKQQRTDLKQLVVKKHWLLINKLIVNAFVELRKNSLSLTDEVFGIVRNIQFIMKIITGIKSSTASYVNSNLLSEVIIMQKDDDFLKKPFLKVFS